MLNAKTAFSWMFIGLAIIGGFLAGHYWDRDPGLGIILGLAIALAGVCALVGFIEVFAAKD